MKDNNLKVWSQVKVKQHAILKWIFFIPGSEKNTFCYTYASLCINLGKVIREIKVLEYFSSSKAVSHHLWLLFTQTSGRSFFWSVESSGEMWAIERVLALRNVSTCQVRGLASLITSPVPSLLTVHCKFPDQNVRSLAAIKMLSLLCALFP